VSKAIGGQTTVVLVHAAAAIAAPAAFWLFSRSGFMGMDLFMLKTAILPLSAITLAVAATRTRFWSGAVAELAAAVA
jgi:hypothetical protein